MKNTKTNSYFKKSILLILLMSFTGLQTAFSFPLEKQGAKSRVTVSSKLTPEQIEIRTLYYCDAALNGNEYLRFLESEKVCREILPKRHEGLSEACINACVEAERRSMEYFQCINRTICENPLIPHADVLKRCRKETSFHNDSNWDWNRACFPEEFSAQ
jgi:hypothetical protein